MSKLDELINLIRDEANINSKDNDNTVSKRTILNSLLLQAINTTMLEIKNGVNSEEFSELVVINLIIVAAEENYPAAEIHEFIEEIKKPIKNKK